MKNYLAIGRKLNLNAFGLLPSSWDLGWIEGTTGSGGGGGGLLAEQDLSSQCNGSRQGFTLSQAPTSSTSVMVYWNGLLQQYGVAYTVSGTSLTTTFTAQIGDTLIVGIF